MWNRIFSSKWGVDPNAPTFWREYIRLFPHKKIDKHQPITATRFIVFDTETTGLNHKQDKLLSIGAVEVLDRQIFVENTFEAFIHQAKTGTKDSIIVHGILQEDLKDGISEASALQQFLSYIGNAVLVGHHVAFDVAMMNGLVEKQIKGKLRNQTLDTFKLAIRFEHFRHAHNTVATNYTLDNLCERYQIRMSDRHTASGDAFITAILFLKLLSRLEKRGIKTLGQLLG